MYIRTKTIEAIEFAGNKSKLANLLNITRQSLTSWGPFLPQSSAQKLFIITKGEIGTQVNENIKEDVNISRKEEEPNPRTPSMFYPT